MKITKHGYKKFIRDNKDNLYYLNKTDFDGMVDGTMPTNGKEIRVIDSDSLLNNKLAWLVGESRDFFDKVDDKVIEVSNCCGNFLVYTK